MTITTTTLPPPTSQDESFPTAAIVVLAVGGYIFIFGIILIVRKCIINKTTGNCCPEWCSEQCQCQSCFENDSSQPGCLTRCATACNCFKYPSKQQCLDSCCPTKQWCDDTFCCCMSQQPQGECCKWDDCCTGIGFGDCCDCPDCKDCCGDCKCECCAQPETLDCCCIEVKLSGAGNRAASQMQSGYGGGYGGPPMPGHGGYMNQPNYYQGGPPVNQQPGWGGMHPGQMQMQNMGSSNVPPVGFNQNYSASQMMQSGSFGGSRGMGNSMAAASMNNMGGSGVASNMFQAQPSISTNG